VIACGNGIRLSGSAGRLSDARHFIQQRLAWRHRTQRSGDLQQHRQHAHHRYKKQRAAFEDLIYDHVRRSARSVGSGTIFPSASTSRPASRPSAPRQMSQARCRRPATNSMSPSAARASSRSRCRRHLRLHPRRHVPDDAQGRHRNPAGQSGAADISIPQNSSGLTINRAGPGLGDLAGTTTPTRSDRSADALHQQGGLQRSRQLFTTRRPRARRRTRPTPTATATCSSPTSSRPMLKWSPRFPTDRGPARLRDERQGHQRATDAAVHLQHVR